MFLVNSRLGLSSAALSRSIRLNFTLAEHPFSRSYGVILPSSLTRVLSRASGFSPRLPVSVSGTGTGSLVRGFSWQFGFSCFATYFSLPFTSQALCRAVFPTRRPTGLDALFQPCAQPTLLRHPFLQAITGGIGLSTDSPSPTPFGLGLGPGLLWADEPSPEILRLSAGRILTCLLAYSYRHSHFLPLHSSFRYCFDAAGTLPYL